MATTITELSAASELINNPAYFFSETADTINKLTQLRKSNTLFLVFLSDSHVYTSSNNMQYFDAQAAALNAICKAIPPDLVVHGGDMTNGSEAKTITLAESEHIVKVMREIGGNNTLILIGNHDGNTVQSDSSTNETNRISESEMLQKYRSWDDGFVYAGDNYQGGQFYGYRDYPNLGIRVIRLHSYIETLNDRTCDGGMGGNWGYYADEVTWFTNVALNTDYNILILSHQTLSPILQGYAENSGIPHRGIAMQQAVDTWLAANNNHKCIGVIHGHVHWDFTHIGKGSFTVIDHNTKTQIDRTGNYGNFYEYGQGLSNYLTTMPTTNTTPTSSYRDVPIGAVMPGRTISTVSQALWTAIIIDPTTNQIDFIRFGAGNDQSINYADTSIRVTNITLSESSGTLTEGQTKILVATIAPTNASNKSVTWTSSNSAVAIVNSGLVTAISEGSAIITATTIDGGFTDTYTLTVQAAQKINQIPLSIDTDGSSYNGGQGYKAGYRLNSSGQEVALTGKYVTGFIPLNKGQKVTLINVGANTAAQDNNYIAFYNSDKVLLSGCSRYVSAWYSQSGNTIKPTTVDEDGWLTSFVATGSTGTYNYPLDDVAFFRIAANYIGSDSSIYVG